MKTEKDDISRPIPTRFRGAEIIRMNRAVRTMGIDNRSALIKLCVHVVLPQIEAGEIKIPQPILVD
jgi:hypothetical protein